jgi:pyridoxamine 5'-phosphate oxidase
MSTHESEIAHLRVEYRKESLSKADVAHDPFTQFRRWFAEARAGEILEPNAMILATVDGAGRPSTRTLLLKAVDATGFTFFTNHRSRKGREMEANPAAALTFLWLELERQVNICGMVEKVTALENDAYFQARPYGSQIGALASDQSSVIPDRAWLEGRFAEVQAENPEGTVVRPPHWGGCRLVPSSVEFWQGRPSRLHDRILYTRQPTAPHGWKIERLSP